jgi:hypothetical protein
VTLSFITFLTCWLFLPGALVWLLFLRIGSLVPRLGRLPILAVAVFGGWLLWSPAVLPGAAGWYCKLLLAAPYAGWLGGKAVCLRTAHALRQRAASVYDGSQAGAMIPSAVPTGPDDIKAERLRRALARLEAEENSNVVLYDAAGAVLGIGPRWGTWSLEEELHDRSDRVLTPFRNWDVVRRVADLMRNARDPQGTPLTIDHWAAFPYRGLPLSWPDGTADIECFRLKPQELQRLSNEAAATGTARYFLVAQSPLRGGHHILTLLIKVVIRDWVLRVTVDAHMLGPVTSHLLDPPASHWVQVTKVGRFYHSESPMGITESVSLMARAPFALWPARLSSRLGGTLALPEPFGLRYSAAHEPWPEDFPKDEALKAAQSVLKNVHAAVLSVLAENSVDLAGQNTSGGIDLYSFTPA